MFYTISCHFPHPPHFVLTLLRQTSAPIKIPNCPNIPSTNISLKYSGLSSFITTDTIINIRNIVITTLIGRILLGQSLAKKNGFTYFLIKALIISIITFIILTLYSPCSIFDTFNMFLYNDKNLTL